MLDRLWAEYSAALDEADPHHEDGILGAAVGQDARSAVSERVRAAARALLNAGVSDQAHRLRQLHRRPPGDGQPVTFEPGIGPDGKLAEISAVPWSEPCS